MWSREVSRGLGRREARAAMLAVLALLGWAVLLVATAGPAAAHAGLERTVPAAGTVTPTAPSSVELTFSEPVDVTLGRIVVMGPDGRAAQAGPPTSTGGQLATVPLRADLARGTYLVSYRVVSEDGHPVAGGFTFSVIAPSPLADVVPAATQVPVPAWLRVALTAAHLAGYAGLTLLAQGLLLSIALRRAGLPVVRAWPPARLGLIVLAVATALAAVTEVAYATGTDVDDINWGTTWAVMAEQARTPVQQAFLARLLLLLIAGPMVRDLTTGRPFGRGRRVEGVLLALGLLATWPLAGHPATGATWPLTMAAGTAHVAAMAVWAGGLAALLACLVPRAQADPLRALLVHWPRQAATAAAVVAGSGVVQAVVQTGSAAALTATTYGLLVLAKVAGTLAVLGAGWAAHRLVTRHLAVTAPDGERLAGRLREVVGVELATMVAVVCLAAALVQVAPGRVSAGGATAADLLVPPSPGQPAYGIERQNGLTLQVDVAPLQVGRNTLLMTLIDGNGAPVTPLSWTVTVSMPREDIHDVNVPVDPTMGAGSAVALPQLSVAGDWNLTVMVRANTVDTIVMHRSIRVY